MSQTNPQPAGKNHVILAVIYVILAAVMLLLAFFRQDDTTPLLCFVLFVAWVVLAIREILRHIREKKASKS